MEGKRDFPQDLVATAAALLEAKDFGTYRQFIRQTSRDAAAVVAQVMTETTAGRRRPAIPRSPPAAVSPRRILTGIRITGHLPPFPAGLRYQANGTWKSLPFMNRIAPAADAHCPGNGP
jgi:hypothetical protein